MNAYLRILVRTVGLVLTVSLAAATVYLYDRPAGPPGEAGSCCSPPGGAIETPASPLSFPGAPESVAQELSQPLVIPDTKVFDQHGRTVHFYSDLVRGRVVAINFIFTTCKGVCPPMGLTFRKLEAAMNGRRIRLISVSVDPVNDTAERLKAWAEQFGAGPDWTLVSGTKQDIDGLLRSLGVFSADKANHSPFVLLGNESAGNWRRIHGLSPVERIQAALEAISTPTQGTTDTPDVTLDLGPDSPARRYFTEVLLMNQYGKTMRLYSDLLQGKVVVIHVFFGACKNTCPVMMSALQQLQKHLGDRLGRDVHLISITVDPENDTVQTLSEYAARVDARPGWFLLTGSKENLAVALGKLGLAVARREEHSNIFIIGNDATHLWKKVHGLAQVEQTIASLDEVIDDRVPRIVPSQRPR
jgi:protein SCO1